MDLGQLGAFSVRYWQFTLVAFLGLVAIGLTAFLTIPRQEDPSFPVPIVRLAIVLPGADPVDIEQLIVDPIEDAINGIEDLKEIRSTSLNGVALITAEFVWGQVDPEKKYDEVVREVNAIRPNLPDTITRFEIDKINTRRTSIVQLALVSETASYRELRDVAERLEDNIDRVNGIWETDVWGIPRTEMRVAVDLGKLSALGLPLDAVAQALRAEGAEIPPGTVHAAGRRFSLKGTGAFESPEEVGSTVLRAVDGRTVRVRDVADVGWADGEPTHLTWYNGERAVFVTATIAANQNIFAVRDGIYEVLDAFEPGIPESIRLERGFDQSVNVSRRLGILQRDFLIALALVMLTLTPLGFRAALVVMMSIPLSLSMGLAGLQFLGFTFNQITIAGFVLALGLVVDDTIVVIENIARHLRMGFSRIEAAIAGMRQIAVAVVGCTATLMLAFVPILFLPEGAGQFLKSLPVTVLLSVGASFIVALTIVPFLASRLLSRHENPEGNAVLRTVMSGIHGIYRPVLHAALLAPRWTLVLAFALFMASLPLVPVLGFSLFPPSGIPQFLVNIELPQGAALSETRKALTFVESVLDDEPLVETTFSNLGRGNPQIFYNAIPAEETSNVASVAVAFREWEDREALSALDRLRASFAKYPGAQIVIKVFENGPPIEAPIAVRVLGPDLGELKRIAAEVTRILEETEGTRDVVNPLRLDRTDLNLGIDIDKAATLGVPAGAIDRTVRIALEGDIVAQLREADGDEFPVVVRLPFGARNDLNALDQVYVPTAGGSAPLSLFIAPAFESGPARIDRIQRERAVTITSEISTGFLASKVGQEAYAKLDEMTLPPGFTIRAGGQAEAQARALGGLGNAMIIAVFGIFAVLVLEFRSFAATAVVACVIPLGVLGALVALWLAGYSLSFNAIVGLIALIGIEIKNSILLVDFTAQLRRQGVPLREAIEQAGEVRFLPVLLTSLTAIGGLTPLALEGSGLFSPLAIAIIGGLVSSTVLSRIVTPAAYLLLAPSDEKFRREEGELGNLPALAE
ncbi:MAG: AcrB/AcrD/AcrF family protein [Alphaproteobacteria bacterium]|nr:AcrB/AcrD/AcrF family protein [Alphaproteobacteria bacterium]